MSTIAKNRKGSDDTNWDNVRVFLAVARAGQILSAAKKLGMDHATASRHLSALEGSMGTRLVERRTSGCVLTPAGERLMTVAERVESELLHVESELTYSDLTVRGLVTVSVPESFGFYFLAQHTGALMTRFPELSLRLLSQPNTISLSKREADVAVALERPTEGRLVSRKLVDFPNGLYMSKGLLSEGPIASIPDLLDRTLVAGPDDLKLLATSGELEPLRAVLERKHYLECSGLLGQVEAIRAGVGFGILPAFVARQIPELVQVFPEISFEQSFWIVLHLNVREVRRIREVQQFVVSTATSHGDHFAG